MAAPSTIRAIASSSSTPANNRQLRHHTPTVNNEDVRPPPDVLIPCPAPRPHHSSSHQPEWVRRQSNPIAKQPPKAANTTPRTHPAGFSQVRLRRPGVQPRSIHLNAIHSQSHLGPI